VEDELLGIIIDRLDAARLPDRATDLLLASYEGQARFDAALGGADVVRPTAGQGTELRREPAGAYLRSVTVQGFRGIGAAATLTLPPGPGLTVVMGRNGSGKSSFAEALELLLTGELRRWEGQHTVLWKEGWRNLHAELPTDIEAELYVEDAGPTSVRRSWGDGAKLTESATSVQAGGQRRADLDSLGWGRDLVEHRPFLSHAELERFFSGRPSDLFDLLASVLGLEDLAVTAARLHDARVVREKALKVAKAELSPLRDELDALDDERAMGCLEALGGKTWDLARAEGIATGVVADPAGDLAQLRRVVQLSAPGIAEVTGVADELTAAASQLEQVMGTDAGRASALADLLRRALAHHRDHGDGSCPVCARPGALDTEWRASTEREVVRLDGEATAATAARKDADEAMAAVRSLAHPPPDSLPVEGTLAGLDVGKAREAWADWSGVPEGGDPASLRRVAAHLTTAWEPFAAALAELTRAASSEIAAREDRWSPVAARLAAWCEGARRAVAGAVDVGALKQAEQWLKGATDDIRNERLRPLAQQTKRIWAQLRQESNVELGDIRLTGANTRRQLDIDVQVDGSASAGLSVMSQGEVNALGLSVFLPRATMPASPFRFLVIDDPVQAMDPAKVEGLARVLGEVAATRQVVVFTHDDRLPEAVRYLEIPATLVEVTRRPGSRLLIRQVMEPVERAIEDARAVVADRELPDAVKARVVGPLCRTALEAAFTEITRRHRLRNGWRRDEVDEALRQVRTLYRSAALALFGDSGRGDDVLRRLGALSNRHPETFKALNQAAHQPFTGDQRGLIDDTRRLVDDLRRVPG
jgi:ABC-type hemin transport system ATPase subunit